MKITKHLILLLGLILTMSCSSNKVNDKKVSSIDSTLQAKATEILKNEMNEICARSGHVIVMDVHTGQIKSLVSLNRKDSLNFEDSEDYLTLHSSALFKTASLLATLESGKVQLSGITDTKDGILYFENNDTIYDNNWHRGGYGEISFLKGSICNSDISTVLALKNAFSTEDEYYKALDKISANKPDSISGLGSFTEDGDTTSHSVYRDAIGFHKCSSLQTIALYNAIANNGVMVQPQIYADSTIVINPTIVKESTINDIKEVLRRCVTEGIGIKTLSDKVTSAGRPGTIEFDKGKYRIEFCGYFPTENPKYCILVSLDKDGLPASGGAMAGTVFKDIMEYIADK